MLFEMEYIFTYFSLFQYQKNSISTFKEEYSLIYQSPSHQEELEMQRFGFIWKNQDMKCITR